MIGKPPHDRRFGIVAAALTMQRSRKNWMPNMAKAGKDIEALLLDSKYYDNAPFWWVTFAAREGLIYDVDPEYGRISKKYGDLPLSMEIDVRDLVDADDETVYNIYARAALTALIHAGRRYNLPVVALEERLAEIEYSLGLHAQTKLS